MSSTTSSAIPTESANIWRLGTGDRVSMHWDWACDRLTARQLPGLAALALG